MNTSNNNSIELEDISFNELSFEYPHSDPSEAADQSLMEKFKSIASISEILRIFGACAVIASMSLFMLEGWSDGNDIQRYLKLLGQTGLLTMAGVALSFIVKEFKGARLFFGLSLISVVANFTILGALIYSVFQFDNGLLEYPAMVTWNASSTSNLFLVCGAAIAMLALLSRFSFSIFARQVSGSLCLSFLALNSLLLVPVRSSIGVSALIIVAVAAAAMMVKHLSGKDTIVQTMEAKFALATLFLPGLLIVGRSLSLYNIDEVLLITLNGLAYFAFRSVLDKVELSSFCKRVIAVGQYWVGLTIAFQFTELLPTAAENIQPMIFSMLAIGFAIDQINQSVEKRWNSLLLNITTALLILVNVGLAVMSSELILKLGGVIVSVVLIALSNHYQARIVNASNCKIFATIGAVISALALLIELFSILNLSNWMVIGVVGMLLIITASFYERFGLNLFSRETSIASQ